MTKSPVTVKDFCIAAFENAKSKGHLDGWLVRGTPLQETWSEKEAAGEFLDAYRIPEFLRLVHDELREAADACADGQYSLSTDPATGKVTGFVSEIADVVILCMNLSAAMGFDLEDAIRKKMAYNATRPHLHGKAR